LIINYTIVVLVGFMINLTPILRAQTAEFYSGVRSALLQSPFLITDSRAEMKIKNDNLSRLLAQSTADLIIANQRLASRSSIKSVLKTNSIVADDYPGTIKSVPLFNQKNQLRYFISTDLESVIDNDTYVVSGSYLLGNANLSGNNKYFAPFDSNLNQLSVIINEQLTVPIEVKNIYTYSISIPKSIPAPEGLTSTLSDRYLLGIKISEKITGDTKTITYQLPFQPQVNDKVQLVSLIDLIIPDEVEE